MDGMPNQTQRLHNLIHRPQLNRQVAEDFVPDVMQAIARARPAMMPYGNTKVCVHHVY